MGISFTKFFDSWGIREKRILMLGLDAAGKSTILYKLKLGDTIQTLPTIGFNVESVQYKNISFSIFDVGGQDRIRRLWKHYFANTDALIYVVDANDRDRISLAKEELDKLMKDDELQDACLLVFANKQDLPHSMTPAEITDKLSLHSFRGRPWYVQGCQATTGAGLYEGLDWVRDTLLK